MDRDLPQVRPRSLPGQADPIMTSVPVDLFSVLSAASLVPKHDIVNIRLQKIPLLWYLLNSVIFIIKAAIEIV